MFIQQLEVINNYCVTYLHGAIYYTRLWHILYIHVHYFTVVDMESKVCEVMIKLYFVIG